MKLLKSSINLIRSRLLSQPCFCHYYVTTKCDLKCKQCTVPQDLKRIDVNNRGDLNLDEIALMAERLKRIGVSNILLSGGEPFAREDLADIVFLLVKQGFFVRISTNGGALVTRDRLLELVDSGMDALQISFDSMNPQLHDEISGKEGTWECAKNNLECAAKNLKGCMAFAITVCSSMNINELPDIAKYATSIGAYSIFQPVHLSSDEDEVGVLGMGDHKEMRVQNEQNSQVDQIYGELLRMKKQGYNILSSKQFLTDSVAYFKTRKRYWTCDAYRYYITVCPHGEVLACMRYEDCDWLGRMNILDDDFVEKFTSRKMRNKAEAYRKRCPGCVYSCYREMSYLMRSPSVFWETSMCVGRKTMRDIVHKKALR